MRLNQTIAIEKDAKAAAQSVIDKSKAYLKKAPLFFGYLKTYQPRNEEDDDLPTPPEAHKVQLTVHDVLKKVGQALGDGLNLTATKDFANCEAKSDVVVGDIMILAAVPVTHLLYLEKVLLQWEELVKMTPVLDASIDWVNDESQGLKRSKEPKVTLRTKKVRKHVIVHAPTDHHPAITDSIDEDVAIGQYTQQIFSGAITAPEKDSLIEKVALLRAAVKMAREEANTMKVERQNVAEPVIDFLLN